MRRSRTPRLTALFAIAVAAVAAQGCGSNNMLTAPGTPSGAAPLLTGDPIGVSDGAWTSVASIKVAPGHNPFTLAGSRYTLQFSRNALDKATTIVVYERSKDVADVRLDPDGTTFSAPVSLTVDYSGTTNDPDSPFFNGQAPRVGRFNASTGKWMVLAGVDNPTAKTYTVSLTGFSRYAMMDGIPSSTTMQDAGKPVARNEGSMN